MAGTTTEAGEDLARRGMALHVRSTVRPGAATAIMLGPRGVTQLKFVLARAVVANNQSLATTAAEYAAAALRP